MQILKRMFFLALLAAGPLAWAFPLSTETLGINLGDPPDAVDRAALAAGYKKTVRVDWRPQWGLPARPQVAKYVQPVPGTISQNTLEVFFSSTGSRAMVISRSQSYYPDKVTAESQKAELIAKFGEPSAAHKEGAFYSWASRGGARVPNPPAACNPTSPSMMSANGMHATAICDIAVMVRPFRISNSAGLVQGLSVEMADFRAIAADMAEINRLIDEQQARERDKAKTIAVPKL